MSTSAGISVAKARIRSDLSGRILFKIQVKEPIVFSPIVSTILTHEIPVNRVKPMAHKNIITNVVPKTLSIGNVILDTTSPTTPPEEKYQISSKFKSARAQLVISRMIKPSKRVPYTM